MSVPEGTLWIYFRFPSWQMVGWAQEERRHVAKEVEKSEKMLHFLLEQSNGYETTIIMRKWKTFSSTRLKRLNNDSNKQAREERKNMRDSAFAVASLTQQANRHNRHGIYDVSESCWQAWKKCVVKFRPVTACWSLSWKVFRMEEKSLQFTLQEKSFFISWVSTVFSTLTMPRWFQSISFLLIFLLGLSANCRNESEKSPE